MSQRRLPYKNAQRHEYDLIIARACVRACVRARARCTLREYLGPEAIYLGVLHFPSTAVATRQTHQLGYRARTSSNKTLSISSCPPPFCLAFIVEEVGQGRQARVGV